MNDGAVEDVVTEDATEDAIEDVTAIVPNDFADEETVEDNIDYTEDLELRHGFKNIGNIIMDCPLATHSERFL